MGIKVLRLKTVMATAIAAGMLLAGAVPVLAGTTTPTTGGTAGSSTCEVTISAAISSGAVSIISSKPCGPNEAPTSCLVVLTGGQLPSPVEKNFNWSCSSAFGANDSTAPNSPWQQFSAWGNYEINQWDSCTGVQSAVCAITNMMNALSSGNVIGTLLEYTTGAMGLPFYAQNGLTSWITTTHQNALSSIYTIMAFLGATVALLAAAFRVISEIGQKGTHVGLIIIGAPVRLFFALALIAGFFELTQWAIPVFNNLASAVYSAIMGAGIDNVFSSNGHMTAQAVAGLAGAGIAGLLGAIVGTLLMIYLFVMLIIRDVILTFGLMLAPIAIALAVYDHRNDMVVMWRNLFFGGLLMSLAGAVGVGVTFAIVGALLNSATASGLEWLVAIVMMIGGLFFTARLMNAVMRGSMSHRSPTSLLVGMGEGAILGMGVRKAIGAGMSAPVSGARAAGGAIASSAPASAVSAGANAVGNVVGRVAAGAPLNPSGALAHANLSTQAALSGLNPRAVDTALINDGQARQVIETATAHMAPDATTAQRLDHMVQSGHHRQLVNRLVESGVGKAQLLNGSDPSQVRFNYHSEEMGNLMSMAHEAARTSTSKIVKGANRGVSYA